MRAATDDPSERSSYLRNLLRRFRTDQSGLTLIEYGLGLAMVVSLGLVALNALGADIGASLGIAGSMMVD